jgi:hypothetical protein
MMRPAVLLAPSTPDALTIQGAAPAREEALVYNVVTSPQRGNDN